MKERQKRTRSSLLTTVLIIFSGSAMIAHSLRMMTQGIFFPKSFYPAPVPTSVDFWFDWFVLCILGISIIIIGAKQWKRWFDHQQKKKQMDQKSQFISS